MKRAIKIISLVFFLVLSETGFVLAEKAVAEDNSNSIQLKINGSSYTLSETEADKWVKKRNALIYDPTYYSEIENINLCQYEKSFSCAMTFDSQKNSRVRKS